MIHNWACDVCGKIREDAKIKVRSVDLSEQMGKRRGSVVRNIKYCADSDKCKETAHSGSFVRLRRA